MNSDNGTEFLVFSVNKTQLAIPTERIQEIFRAALLEPPPHSEAPTSLLGLLCIRGNLYPVHDILPNKSENTQIDPSDCFIFLNSPRIIVRVNELLGFFRKRDIEKSIESNQLESYFSIQSGITPFSFVQQTPFGTVYGVDQSYLESLTVRSSNPENQETQRIV